MSDREMENSVFDRIIGDKLRSAEPKGGKPQWPKMKRLLWAHGFKTLSAWYYFLFGILVLSLALNAVFLLEKPKSTTIFSAGKNNPQISDHPAVFVKRDTLLIVDTVYVHKVIKLRQYSALSAEADQSKSGLANRNFSPKKSDTQQKISFSKKNNLSEKTPEKVNNKGVLVYKDRRINKPVTQKVDSTNLVASANHKIASTPVKNNKTHVRHGKRKNRILQFSGGAAKSQNKRFTTKKQKKQSNPFVVHLKLGAGLETAFITSKGITGTTVSYGFVPEVRLTKRIAFYSGFWFVKQQYKYADNVTDFSSFSSVISDPTFVSEVKITNNIYKIPLGIKLYFPINSRFEMSWNGTVNYLKFNKQNFIFEIKNQDETHLSVSKNNTYAGFGSADFGLGASYSWRDKLSLELSPQVGIPLTKVGAEKMKYGYFITQFIISWRF